MTAEINDSVGRGPGRVEPGFGDGLFYQPTSRGEGGDGRSDLAQQGGGCTPRRGRQKEVGVGPNLVASNA